MSKRNRHQATDIDYSYGTVKLEKIRNTWQKFTDEEYLELLFLLALMGISNNNRISLSEEDGDGKKQFSRVVYQNNQVAMDSMIGLISILGNKEKNKSKVVNEIAFAKMDNYNLPFSKMPNVKDFYEYVLGGIDPLYDLLFELGDKETDIATVLFDEAMSNESDLSLLIAELMLEDE